MGFGIFVGGSDIGIEIFFELAKHFGEIDAGVVAEWRGGFGGWRGNWRGSDGRRWNNGRSGRRRRQPPARARLPMPWPSERQVPEPRHAIGAM